MTISKEMDEQLQPMREAIESLDPFTKNHVNAQAKTIVGPLCSLVRDGSRSAQVVAACALLMLMEAMAEEIGDSEDEG